MDLNEWERVISVNITGAMLITKYAVPLLKCSNGDKAIVNISSDQAWYPRKRNSAYSVSKAGIVGFSRASAVELIESKIRVNSILPASVRSSFIRNVVRKKEEMDELYKREDKKMPLGLIEPEEVAELIFFLGSDKSKKITGQSIIMDSGVYI